MTKKKARDPFPPFKFSSFFVPGQVNTQKANSGYLKSDAQTGWAKRAKPLFAEHPQTHEPDEPDLPNGWKTIVIHPGSSTIRLGRASDYAPVQIHNLIARKRVVPLQAAQSTSTGAGSGSSTSKGKQREASTSGAEDMDVDGPGAFEPTTSSNPMEVKIASLRQTLNQRTTGLKLKPLPQARAFAASYNAESVGEPIQDMNDPFRVEWDLDGKSGEHGDVVVGEEVFKLSTAIWDVRRPWLDRTFNERDYSSVQANVVDMQELLREALVVQMGISAKEIKSYSAVLVIPDHVSAQYVQQMSEMLLGEVGKGGLGFKQICVQQESLGATFGAGLSSACVVDIGSRKTTIACVEDGMVLGETRHSLSYGGDDITAFLAVLLQESHFPHKELDMATLYDWRMIEGLKERFCTLSEAQVGVNLYDFFVRRPRKMTKKYTIKTFDEVILAPMVLFEPRVIDFESRSKGRSHPGATADDVEEAGDYSLDQPTLAMNHSTFHLRPPPPPPPPAPAPIVDGPPPVVASSSADIPSSAPPPSHLPSHLDPTTPFDPSSPAPPTTLASALPLPSTPSASLPIHTPTTPLAPPPPPAPPAPEEPQPLGFDIIEEAGKVPLDIAIVNALMACGTEERVRRMAGSLLLVGGTAGIPALGYAIQSRVLPILNSRFPALQTVQIIPSPREIDPRLLVWKGISVLARLESVNDFFVDRKEWERFGIKSLREKSFFL